jgi:beta-glucanase (GH16 family)
VIATCISWIAVLVTSTPISLDSPILWPGFELSVPLNGPQDEYQLVWFDDFEGDSLDLSKWYPLIDCSGRGNNELQCYTNRTDNIRVENGVLELVALPEKYEGRNFTSGRIHASGQGWKYGFFETRARLPKGKHLWPAIWMVPSSGIYGPWPMSGEIDIMEMRGQKSTFMESTIHYGASRSDRTHIGSGMMEFPFDFSEDYHIFGFEWTNTSMSWLLDGIKYYELSTDRWFVTDKGTQVYNQTGSPFDHSFKWILNVAIGGGYFPRETYGDITWEESFKWEKPVMEVDWVRVFQKVPEETFSSLSSTSLSSTETETTPTAVTTTTTTPITTTERESERNFSTTATFDFDSEKTKPTPIEATSSTSLETTTDSPVSHETITLAITTTSPETTITTTTINPDVDFEKSNKKDEDKKIKDSPETIDNKKGNEVVLYDYESGGTNEDPVNTYYYDTL